jgi:hypothetical protein
MSEVKSVVRSRCVPVAFIALVSWLAACSGSMQQHADGGAGTGGTKGTGGNTGAGGTKGTGGTTGTGGAKGTGGSSDGGAGTGGTKGTGGNTDGGAGTGGTKGTGGNTDGGVNVGPLKPLINAVCAAARACCAKDPETAPTTNLDDCETMLGTQYYAVPGVVKGTTTVSSTVLSACVAAYQAAATSCVLTGVETACQGLYVGTKGDNEPCTTVLDCRQDQGTATCFKVQTASGVTPDTGTCKKIPHGARGDACLSDCLAGNSCLSDTISGDGQPAPVLCFETDGFYCSYGSDKAVCTPIVATNGSCMLDNECGGASYCDFDSMTCLKRPALGGDCTFSSACPSQSLCISQKCTAQPLESPSFCSNPNSLPAP